MKKKYAESDQSLDNKREVAGSIPVFLPASAFRKSTVLLQLPHLIALL